MQLYETTLPGGAWLRGWVRDATESMPDYNVRPAVLVLPGGGYAHCSVREGDPVAARFLAAGYQVFLLNYTVAEDPARAPLGYAPLTDAARALLHLRRHAAALRLDPAGSRSAGFRPAGTWRPARRCWPATWRTGWTCGTARRSGTPGPTRCCSATRSSPPAR